MKTRGFTGVLLVVAASVAQARSVVIVAAPPASAQPAAFQGWAVTAVSLRGKNATRSSVDCPARGTLRSVWGAGPYTDDSSICSAAVHAGLIQVAGGGRVTFEIRPGQASYPGTTQHGVTSASWASWHGSFAIVGATALPAPRPGAPLAIGWSDAANTLSAPGVIAVACPPRGTAGSLWGSAW